MKSLTVDRAQDVDGRGQDASSSSTSAARTSASVAKIDRARALDADGEKHLLALDKKTPIVFQCHHGMRSKSAAERFLREGFTNVYNLEGGIEAWSQKVDPKVARY